MGIQEQIDLDEVKQDWRYVNELVDNISNQSSLLSEVLQRLSENSLFWEIANEEEKNLISGLIEQYLSIED
jgi:hypothetical protein